VPTFHAGRGIPARLACQLADGAGVGESDVADADGAGEAEPSVGDGAGDEVVAVGLLAGDGLSVADGLLVGDRLLAGAGAADGEVVGELAGDGGTAGAGTGIGSVALGAELGNRVMTGGVGAGLCLAIDGTGAGAEAGEAATLMGRPSRKAGPAAAYFSAALGEPPELVTPAR